MQRTLHFISLDTVGGVEVLFHELMKHYPDPSAINCIALYSSGIHDFFRSTIADHIHTAKSIKYLGQFKLPTRPHRIRKWNHHRILNAVNPDVVVFWNSINNGDYIEHGAFHRESKFILYDHGTSWYKEKNYLNSQLFLSKISLCLCCSYASKRMMELYHQYNGEIKIIYNPLRPDFLIGTPVVKHLPKNRRVRLGVAGRFVHIKGICLAIHTVEILKHRGIDVELHIAGMGKHDASYKKIAKQLGVEKRVVFLGLVEDMPQYYQNIDIFLCPSIREPFGIVAAEAMGSGCPIICSRIDGLAEVVEPGKTGFCLSPTLPIKEYEKLGGGIKGLPEVVYYPELDAIRPPMAVDPGAMANAVQMVLAESSNYTNMSRKCIEVTRERFSFNHYVKKMISILRTEH